MNKPLDLEIRISRFLRAGTVVAGILIFLGWLWDFDAKANLFMQFGHYQESPLGNDLRLAWTRGRWGLLLSYAGLASLISLPVIRVLLTMVLFVRQKEARMAIIAGVVLFSLLASMALGLEI